MKLERGGAHVNVRARRLAIIVVGAILAAPLSAAILGGSVARAGVRTAAAIEKSAGAFHEYATPARVTARVQAPKSYRADRLFAFLAAAWAILVVGLWLTRARLRVDATLTRLVSVRPRGPPILLPVS